MIACFLSNISAKYYKNPSMLSRVIAKNVGDVFFETQCTWAYERFTGCSVQLHHRRDKWKIRHSSPRKVWGSTLKRASWGSMWSSYCVLIHVWARNVYNWLILINERAMFCI